MADTILVVDDDLGIQKQLKWSLTDYNVVFADDRQSAIAQLRRFEPSVVTLDLGLPPDPANASEGLKTLEEIMALSPRTKVIVVTGNNDKENALRAIDLGAYDFYQKPIDSDTIKLLVNRALNLSKLEDENRILAKTRPSMGRIIGNSEAIQLVMRKAEKIAGTDISTLLLGESGTGKEVFARSIHEHSPRKDKPFVAINCASIPENLLESELFGYEKGAFTGANKTTMGKIETAQGGTLFLDEIGDMPIGLQAKMLRFLQERVIERVGGRNEIPVDIRVICATHRDLQTMVAEESFREDLFYRIGEIPINIPPLRDREQDIVLLARTFLNQYREEFNAKAKSFSDGAIKALLAHKWPGNIRELQNKLKSAVIMAEGTVVQAEDLGLIAPTEDFESDTLNLREVREQAESRAIRKAYQRADKNMSKTAELLGVTRPTLYSLIDKYHLEDLKTGV
ncbi:MAG: PEP-CTERM-box response regulator transcription factor [Pseudomonadota bacterium]|jgi:putative PEP-CTERM system response regulator|uniref:PEP-CTERM-box response regulator transcription factor n=1 Tax=Marisediminitalea aggregata TaxID=634436 RepID=A0A1M5LNC5_9ALTE|nr:PEP-CTERM-box response regulator transcription factor [Marisediminitalea aggregata]MAP22770.1 PEP-CTERM-box response regulator transcription factor [Alteromonadaceae bacterium]MCP3861547.1 PEP-CTERM-box response regulator transcription factor [Aestuariibacter sp.]MEC7825178.1 PEP-CTERM-box response regulator transcription factor [Pseudomonadota bacterium]BBO26683.1 PEP-CTERM-box response regulator transcription factor [Alteromonas sp. I4]MAX41797.1 PEP-CTERM-box response regulator transcrip|tara:strand:+ start:370 stop:1731 length:1362 start_codon:yes stop_codon:yes gene_type:complete